MKKINLLMIYASTISLMVAQNVALEKVNITQEELRTTKTLNYTPSTNDRNPLQTAATPLWSDDFSDPTTWTLGHAPGSNLDWVIGRGFDTENPLSTINSSSKLNGFAFLDSYRYTLDNKVKNNLHGSLPLHLLILAVMKIWSCSLKPIIIILNLSVMLSSVQQMRIGQT